LSRISGKPPDVRSSKDTDDGYEETVCHFGCRSGRGIALAKAISFDKLDFRGCGNQVVALVSLKGIDAESWPEEKRKVA
jgi:hypothetical protein